MKRVLLVLSRGFEEMEAVAPLDLLRRAHLEVISASTGPGLAVEGSHGITLMADRLLDDCLAEAFDLVVLPGGPGVKDLRRDPRVLDLVRDRHRRGLALAAICAAPLVLADAGIAGGLVMTSFPGEEAELRDRVKTYSRDRVVADGQVITSRGAGTAEEFALELVAFLAGPEAAEKVRRAIVAR